MNKKGWTLVGELVVFLICVIVLIYAVYGFGVLGLTKYSSKLTSDVKTQFIVSRERVTYESVQEILVDATNKYVWDKYNGSFAGEVIVVRISTLVESGYINVIKDSRNKKCSGYVKVNNRGYDLVYTPYLKCSKYMSSGYEKDYDW